jgi:hypothetical protein
VSKVTCRHCDFCGKSEHERAVIVIGPRADICDECARYVISRLPEPTDAQIDTIADSMPGGMEGFLKGWGWRQFARKVLELVRDSDESERAGIGEAKKLPGIEP